MTTIIGLVIVFLAILFTISLVLTAIVFIQYFNKYGTTQKGSNLNLRMVAVAVLYTLIFYWYF